MKNFNTAKKSLSIYLLIFIILTFFSCQNLTNFDEQNKSGSLCIILPVVRAVTREAVDNAKSRNITKYKVMIPLENKPESLIEKIAEPEQKIEFTDLQEGEWTVLCYAYV